jgi:uncharacterized protein YndB with AHSA1/START domain
MTDRMTSKFSRVDSGLTDHDFQAIVNINAAPDDVFDALTSTEAVSSWWSSATGSGKAGSDLVVWFGEQRVNLHVDEAERPAGVHWSVTLCEPIPDWVGTNIAFELSPAAGGTRLDFRHYGLTPQLECFDMCQNGWTEKLGNLLNFMEAGS